MNEMNIKKQDSQKKPSLLNILFGIFIFLVILYFVYEPAPFTREEAYQIKCMTNLSRLGKALRKYAQDYNNVYPTPEKWCDLLALPEEISRCPGGKGSRCDYAMNPNCEPNSPEEMVLLFESTGGWNQFGGPELLNLQNHNGNGCSVLFNDFHLEFVESDQLEKLKWKNSEVSGNE